MGRRGSKKGVKRGPYKKHTPDLLGSLNKLATRNRQKYDRERKRLLRGTPPSRFFKPGRPPKRFLLKDFEKIKKAKKLKVKAT